MNVVYVIGNLDRGGAQTQLRNRIAGLSARGYRQHVIALSERFNVEVVASVRQAGASVEIIGRLPLYTLVGFGRIIREFRRRRPDVVHTELPGGDLIGRTMARIAGVPSIVSRVSGRYVDKPRLQFLLDKATIGWADRVVFVAPEIVQFSIRHEGVKPDQVVCIRSGVVPDPPERLEAAAALRKQYGAEAETIIGMAARLHPGKAHPDLLSAFATIAARRGGMRLWIVGDGSERQNLVAQSRRLGIADQVLFAGDRDDARDWIAAMDVFVHPTHSEGLPNSVLEAMVSGKPVIASNVDGLGGLIKSGVNGWLVEPGDSEALAHRMQYVLDHPDEAVAVARNGAEHVLKHFSVERLAEAYDQLFTSLMKPMPRALAPAA
jgi:glycosyltransferase involved in cell wall biosynthesis